MAPRWGRAKGRAATQGARAALRRSLLALFDGDLSIVERELTGLLQIDSSDIDLYLALARLFRRRGEVGRAIRVHQNLLLRADLEPRERREALLGLAQDFRSGGFLRRAIACYEELLERDPRHPKALGALVALSQEVGDFAGALAAARRLARCEGAPGDPSEAALQVGLATAERAEGRLDAARQALKRALRKDPKNVDAHLLLGEIEVERGRNKAALVTWRAVPGIDRRRGPEIYPRLAATFAALGRARDYEKFLRDLLDQEPEDADARTALGEALAARGAADESVAEFRRVLDGSPTSLAARIALGRLLLAENRHAEARKEFGELLEVLDASLAGRVREKLR